MSAEKTKNYSEYYRSLVALLGLSIVGFSLYEVINQPFNWQWVAIVLLSLLISRATAQKVFGAFETITVSDTFIYLAILLLDTDHALLLAALITYSESVSVVKRQSFPRFSNRQLINTFNVGLICIPLFISDGVIQFTFGKPNTLAHKSETFWLYISSITCFALLQGILNILLLAVLLELKNEKLIWQEWVKKNSWMLVTSVSGVMMAAIVNALVHYFGFWAILSTIPLIAGAYAIALPYLKNIEAARRHSEEMDKLHQRALEAFATAVDAKDQITHDHVRRVQIYAEGMARLVSLTDLEIKALHAGALLHDIGKIAVPDFIINKPGKLTAFEFDKMKTHTVVGAQILDQIQFPYPLVQIVRYHHERWDGKGYPEGLKEENIPLTARILSIVDCFDAVREDRQYRKGMTREQAINLLLDDRSKAFDPKLVDLFIANLPTFEEQIAQSKQDAQVFKPIEITETQAIRDAKPAAGLMEEKKEAPAFVKAIQESRRLSQESYALYDIAENLAGKLSIPEICHLIGNKMDNVIPFDPVKDTCVFYWYEEDSFSAHVQHAIGAQAEKFQGCTIKPGEGVTGWVLANNQPFANTDSALDLYILGIKRDINDQLEKYNSLAVFPLCHGGDTFGAMAVYTRSLETFKSEEIDRLKRLTTLASQSLWSAKLYLEAQQSAVTDSLTGLPNARYLRSCFAQEKKACAQDQHPLSLLVVDLSYFRYVSDKINNQRADQTIQQIAKLMRGQIRGSDTLVHFLGDEFILLLRNTSEDTLMDVVARIQSDIIEHRPSLLSAEEAMFSVSIGQAQLGRDGDTLDKLLDAAQMRLQADRAAHRSLTQAYAA